MTDNTFTPAQAAPVGFAPYHPKLGWDLARSSHHQGDVEAFLEHANQDWEARPLYAAQPPAAPVERDGCPIAVNDPRFCSAGCCQRCSDFRDGWNASREPEAPPRLSADIVERLRPIANYVGLYKLHCQTILEAADEIERLRAQPQGTPDTDAALRQLLEMPRDIDDRVIRGEIKDGETVYLKANGAEFRRLKALVTSTLPRPDRKTGE